MRTTSSWHRWALLGLLGVLTTGWTVGCPQPPKPRPRQGDPRVATRPRTRPRTPPPPAPRGPDIKDRVLLSVQVDSLARLDRRILAMLPPMMQRLARGKALQRLLPDLARSVGLNALGLDALDSKRPAAFGVLVKKDGAGLKPQLVAVIPLKGDGKLIVDAVKASYGECTEAPWGGLHVKDGGDTVTWVGVREGWAVLAPTGPLLDSAYRHLVPLARKLPAGGMRAQLRFKELLTLLRPVITAQWRQIKGWLTAGSDMGKMMGGLLPQLERVGDYLASVDAAELELTAGTGSWRWQARVKTQPKGLLAKWLARQQQPGTFGLDVLPSGAFVAVNDWSAAELRTLVHELLTGYIRLKLSDLGGRLPSQVESRGLFKKRNLSAAGYRRALRDLNLKDYKTSYRVYRVVLMARRFSDQLKKTLPRLIQGATGTSAAALYATAGPGLGVGLVEQIKDPRKHARDFTNVAWGSLRSLNALIREAWKLAPAELTRHLGARAPLQFVYNPRAARVGLVSVSTLGLRITWPKPPRGRKATPAAKAAHAMVAGYRKALETVLGPGDVVYAWAYVGKRHLASAGKQWKARMQAMVLAATGKKGPSVLTDTLLGSAPAAGTGDRLTRLHFSATRLTTALLEAVKTFAPQLTRSMTYKLLAGFLRQAARGAKGATTLQVSRHRGAYVISSRLPDADLKSILLLGAWLFMDSGASGSKTIKGSSHSAPKPQPTTTTP